jgi:hypothetical protein
MGRPTSNYDTREDLLSIDIFKKEGVRNLSVAIVAQAAKDALNGRYKNEVKKFFNSEWFKLLMMYYPKIDGNEIYNQILDNYEKCHNWRQPTPITNIRNKGTLDDLYS